MNRTIIFIILAIGMSALLITIPFFNKINKFQTLPLSEMVNPMVGTDAHGHTFPGAVIPFGMVQLSPDTRLSGWDGCGGYHYSDSVMYGFSHTHLSGTGCSDYGDILIVPMSGFYSMWNVAEATGNTMGRSYTSKFSHATEKASPGYYSVFLETPGVDAEMTVTQRVGFHKYHYRSMGKHFVILDLEHRDKLIETSLKKISDTRYVGLRRSKEWADDQYVYFVIDFSSPVEIVDYRGGLLPDKNNENMPAKLEPIPDAFNSQATVYVFEVADSSVNDLMIKTALSTVSTDGAIKNMEAELPDWDFDSVKHNAEELWNAELSKIIVKGGSDEQRKVFYTALYHSFIHPSLAQDVDGQFRGTDLQVHKATEFTNYTVFSLWDTYRAIHPLFTIVQQKRTLDFIKTFLAQFTYGGQLPMWELSANETGCMIGYHAVPPIVDAYSKGITDFDTHLALKAMLQRAEADELGKHDYMKYGFLPIESEHESVSKTLEYGFDDWCIARFAKMTGNEEVFKNYLVRSQAYKHIFDTETGFMRPKQNGSWKTPFDPKEVDCNYTEANAWQYSFYVPHDILGLIAMMGGKEMFEAKLDELFSADSKTAGRTQADITGLIGQYAHGNEPSHHIAYLYNYCCKPEKTQKMVRRIMNEMYNSTPSGNCGNEDCGQMSAWYVFSAMGFYPVNPANGVYDFGSPIFDTVVIQLENGKNFTIIAHNNSAKNMYIDRIELNGRDYKYSYLLHKTIMKGGKLEFYMSDKPGNTVGKTPETIYHSVVQEHLVTPVPYTDASRLTFYDSIQIQLSCPVEGAMIYFRCDSTKRFLVYTKPFTISENTVLQTYAKKSGMRSSKTIEAKYIKIEGNRKIKLNSTYDTQYSAGGDDALIDRIKGNKDFRSGTWQGYQGQDFEVVVDLGEIKPVKTIETCFIQELRSWILLPLYVEYYFSVDGTNFVKMSKITHNIPDTDYNQQIFNFTYTPENQKTRYIKVFAKYYGQLPEWHLGAGGKSWLFADEIDIICK
ncbi:MAG: GH92 family glycosyl hydrolase [Bacteroidales bacterium]|nr:GH92 family glycosyl hydrolase [Bacteroidales bacterium]HQP02990.1 GH92 family glycosyl hydrolase [Bacteroidales bacterium]